MSDEQATSWVGASTELDRRLVRAAGDRALLVTPPSTVQVSAVVAAVNDNRLDGVLDVLPAAETVLVTLSAPDAAAHVRAQLVQLLCAIDTSADVSRGTSADPPDDPVRIPVRYDGVDLLEVAGLLEMSVVELVEAHTGVLWRCAFVGFAPGFGYLECGDSRLAVPRRTEPRTAIPVGAVALAGGYSGVYPRASPGGWQLIGHTDAPMWDPERDPPALVRAGATVRFVAVDR